MLRLLSVLLILMAGVVRADRAEDIDRLIGVLNIAELVEVMRQEGLVFSEDIASQMLAGGDAMWEANVSRVYNKGKMIRTVRQALDAGLSDGDVATSLDFFQAATGRKVVGLETSARRAMLDVAVEENARASFTDLEGSDDARLAMVAEFVQANDLIEANVAGGLSSNYLFFRGLIDGGGMDADEKDILADVWAQEEEIRDDTREWVFGFSLLAYQPLSDDELRLYVDMSGSPAGQALNAALFDGFDAMYADIAYALGLAAAQAMQGQDL